MTGIAIIIEILGIGTVRIRIETKTEIQVSEIIFAIVVILEIETFRTTITDLNDENSRYDNRDNRRESDDRNRSRERYDRTRSSSRESQRNSSGSRERPDNRNSTKFYDSNSKINFRSYQLEDGTKICPRCLTFTYDFPKLLSRVLARK